MTASRPIALSPFALASRVALGAAILLAPGLAPRTALGAGRRALLIGNDAYPGEDRLPSCVNDARAMRAWLLTVGYEPGEIDLVEDATKPRILEALRRLDDDCRSARPEQVVIYYSGHGSTMPDDDGDEGAGDDTDEALVGIFAPGQNPDQFLVRDDEFFKDVGRVSSSTRQLVVILDACFSGVESRKGLRGVGDGGPRFKQIREVDLRDRLVKAGRPVGPLGRPRDINQGMVEGRAMPGELPEPGADRSLIFISSSNQFQLSAAGERMSKFTEEFLKAVGPGRLNRVRADGVLTMDSLLSYLKGELQTVPQTPRIIVRGLEGDLQAALIPGVFPDEGAVRRRARLAALLDDLVSLPSRNRAVDWSIKIRPTVGPPLPQGQPFALEITPSARGHLVLLSLTSSGEVSLLFPNRYATGRNPIDARKVTTIPYKDGLIVQPRGDSETYLVYLLEKEAILNLPLGDYFGAMNAGRLSEAMRRAGFGDPPDRLEATRVALERGAIGAPTGPGRGGEAGRWTCSVVTFPTVGR